VICRRTLTPGQLTPRFLVFSLSLPVLSVSPSPLPLSTSQHTCRDSLSSDLNFRILRGTTNQPFVSVKHTNVLSFIIPNHIHNHVSRIPNFPLIGDRYSTVSHAHGAILHFLVFCLSLLFPAQHAQQKFLTRYYRLVRPFGPEAEVIRFRLEEEGEEEEDVAMMRMMMKEVGSRRNHTML